MLSERLFNPILHIDLIFHLTSLSKRMNYFYEQFNSMIWDIITKNQNIYQNFDKNPTVLNQLSNPKNKLSLDEIHDEVLLFALAVSLNLNFREDYLL